MLYIYHYPEDHSLEKLNLYLQDFLSKIEKVKVRTTFSNKFFHNEFIPVIERSEELRRKFKIFFDNFKKLSDANKGTFCQLVLKSQNVESFFSDISLNCDDLHWNNLSVILGDTSFKDLINHLFKTTLRSSFDLKGHYALIYDNMAHKICPFCGVEIMHKSFQQDYDHLAAKSKYPLMGINPKNLAPMCSVCNTKSKGEKDIFYNTNNKRIPFVNPYKEKLSITLDYNKSIIPQTELTNQNGKWSITILPKNEMTKNWDRIFKIRKRYVEDFIEPNFEDWMHEFITDCIWANKDLSNSTSIIDELRGMGERLKDQWYKNNNLIKAPLFMYLSTCGNSIFYNSIIGNYNRIKSQNLVA